jgi:hypothetical protein
MDELDVLRVRDETLQAMYWMRAEGLAEAPETEQVARFLAVPPATLEPYLERFARDGWLERRGAGWVLSEAGAELGKRGFADEFAGLTGQAHGECDDDCWCHESPEEAARCLEERRQRVH